MSTSTVLGGCFKAIATAMLLIGGPGLLRPSPSPSEKGPRASAGINDTLRPVPSQTWSCFAVSHRCLLASGRRRYFLDTSSLAFDAGSALQFFEESPTGFCEVVGQRIDNFKTSRRPRRRRRVARRARGVFELLLG